MPDSRNMEDANAMANDTARRKKHAGVLRSPFNPRSGSWEIEWPGRISRHDLVYLSPPEDPLQGVPLGNGDMGVLAWCEGSRLVMAVNKCDLWDDVPMGRFHNWKPEEEERSTTLRHAGRIIIDFTAPIFDLFYISRFSARLDLAEAMLRMEVAGPFGSVELEMFVSREKGSLCGRAACRLTEDFPLTVIVERYGSRTFSHWYSLVNRDPAIGLAGTEAAADKNGAYVTHELSTGTFALGCSITETCGLSAVYDRKHSHCASIALHGAEGGRGKEKAFSFIVSATSPGRGPAVAAVKQKIEQASARGWSRLLESHRSEWKAFWMRSLMECGDDYLDNLWHLTMYYARSSQGGPSPGRFINGLWTWNRDVQNWNFYFHWNQQELYWPLNAAGHHDLVEGYLRYRFDSLPHAREDAREAFHAKGAVIADVADRRGCNSAGELGNHTPVAQIAMEFYRQYRYTGDERFLREMALPFILEAARFFESLFEKGTDGMYHAREGTGYEGWIKLADGITELVYARVLFETAIRCLTLVGGHDSSAVRWREILAKLVPLPTIAADQRCIGGGGRFPRYLRGTFKGKRASGRTLLAAGFGIEEKRLLSSKIPVEPVKTMAADPFEMLKALETNTTPYSAIREDMKCNDGIFPFVEYSAIYPSGLIGIAQRGTELFRIAADTVRLFAPDAMGWDPLPIALARLGLGRELSQILGRWPGRWQFYRNGFGHYGPRDIMKADGALRFRTTLVRDAASPDSPKFPFPAWPFRHMGMESMSVLATAMNESLLQSHEGLLRVAPAVHEGQSARFTLHAEGGFVVSAEVEKGAPRWVCVESLRGGPLELANPWNIAFIQRDGGDREAVEDGIVALETRAGERIVCAADEDAESRWEVISVRHDANKGPKSDSAGSAMLGLPRMY